MPLANQQNAEPETGADAKEQRQSDASLFAFLHTSDEKASENFLTLLVSEQTETTISRIVRHKLRVSLSPTDGTHQNQEALDLIAEVQTALVTTLRDLRNNPSRANITNLTSYCATTSFNACNQYLRKKYPNRWRLKNKLRYLLTHTSTFNLWETDERDWVCGFKPWTGTQRPLATQSQLQRIRDDSNALSGVAHDRSTLTRLLTAIFQKLDCPVLLDELVSLVAVSMGIVEDRISHDAEEDSTGVLELSSQPSALMELEQRAQLESLWKEICELPLRHRAALLLNLRDKGGADILTVFPSSGVATIREIAASLELTPEVFAVMWNQLPWDDLKIAEHLGITRQQVINLRHSARVRLNRRLGGSKG